jgi:hypothetical protein
MNDDKPVVQGEMSKNLKKKKEQKKSKGQKGKGK